MTTNASASAIRSSEIAKVALQRAAMFWFVTAVVGQWIFAYYTVVFYGGSAVRGDVEAVNKNLIHGIIPGDHIGNLMVITHLVLAAIITFGGPLQIILGAVLTDARRFKRVPNIRATTALVHRFNGRIYMMTALLISVGGLHMIWTRGTIGGLAQHIAISLNAILIIVFAVISLRYAIKGKIQKHKQWALRLFLAVSGVWFFRVGLMLWMSIHQRPVGYDPATFTGPFLYFLAFAQYLLPLFVLEVYFRIKDRGNALGRFAMAITITLLTIAMGVGIYGAFTGMWLPKM